MRIAYISAGAAGMYCGSCMNDNALAGGLKRLGLDVALVPTYTPMRTDGDDVSIDQVFYGAVNVYLQQKSALFRHTPRLLDRQLDRRGLLDRVGALSGSTSGHELAELSLSILRGEDGHQKKELERLATWLAEDFRPQLVHLTNSMFLGMAAPLRRRLGVPIVCSLQGEDLFLDSMPEPHRSEVLTRMRACAQNADLLLAPNEYYRGMMAELLQFPIARVRVVPLGIDLNGHEAPPTIRPERPFTVGYLARVAPEKGLHHLVDAFHELHADQPGQYRLAIAGYLGSRDRPYFEALRLRLHTSGLSDHVDYRGEVDRAGKLRLLAEIDVLAVPTVYREAKGRFLLEALASGVPVIAPDHGTFPELVGATGGGLLVPPQSPAAIAAAVRTLAGDPKQRQELGQRGRRAVHERYSSDAMAKAMAAVYRGLGLSD